MTPEDFEARFAHHDPAKALTPMTDSDIDDVVAATIAAPTHRSTRNKWLSGAAAVAVVAIALNAPGANVAGPAVLHLGAPTNASEKTAANGSVVAGGNQMSDMMLTAGYHFIAASPTITDFPLASSLKAYKVVPLDNIDVIAQRLIKKFGVADYKTTKENGVTVWWNDATKDTYIYVYDGSSASFSYSKNDWTAVSCSVSNSDPKLAEDMQECNPDFVTIDADEAKSRVKAFLSEFGLPSDNLKFTIDQNGYGTSVSAVVTRNGFETPMMYWFNFGDKGELVSASGTLQEIEAIGDYNLLSPIDAIDRENKRADAQLATWQASSEVRTSSGSSAGDSATPTIDNDTAPTMTLQDAYVTSVTLTMVQVWDVDGSALWIPGYAFDGHIDGNTETWTLASVIAVVDSQIDYSQFTGGGVMSMNDSTMAVK